MWKTHCGSWEQTWLSCSPGSVIYSMTVALAPCGDKAKKEALNQTPKDNSLSNELTKNGHYRQKVKPGTQRWEVKKAYSAIVRLEGIQDNWHLPSLEQAKFMLKSISTFTIRLTDLCITKPLSRPIFCSNISEALTAVVFVSHTWLYIQVSLLVSTWGNSMRCPGSNLAQYGTRQ